MSKIEDYYNNKLNIYMENLTLSEKEKDDLCMEYLQDEKEIKEEFRRLTGLNFTDMGFLFFAVALQVIRQYILGGHIGEVADTSKRPKHNDPDIKREEKRKRQEYKDKHYDESEKVTGSKKYRSYMEIAMTSKVPYDAQPPGLSGKNHRYKSLGHDPLLGWVFGTMNILTDTITLNNFMSYDVDMHMKLTVTGPTTLLNICKDSIETTREDYKRLAAAVFSQGVHLKSDEFTKAGLPIPGTTILGGVFEDLYMSNYDKLCFQRDLKTVALQAAFAMIINQIIALVHGFYYDEKEYPNPRVYEVKTRKILLYSNIIASGSNILFSYFTKNIRYLDIGGAMVAIYRIVQDIPFMLSLEKEFINSELSKKYQREIDKLDMDIYELLDKINNRYQ